MRVSLPPLHHTSSRYSVWAHGQLYVCLEQYVSCETGRSCESVAPGIRFSDLPIAKCFLVICLPFLDESWNERSDDRELCRWQKATSCEWIAENLWKGCVEGHVARMGEMINACKIKDRFNGLCLHCIIHRITLHSRLCLFFPVRNAKQGFGNWICLCPQVEGWRNTYWVAFGRGSCY